jgi:DNA-binding MarR family transcriptional regulator
MATETLGAVADWVLFYRGYSSVYTALDRALVTQTELSAPQALVLLHLGERGPVRNTDLAAFMQRQAQSLTGLIDRLEAKKLVKRSPFPGDRRAIRLSITPAGQKAVSAAVPVMDEVLQASLGRLHPSDRTFLENLVARHPRKR